MDYKNGSKYWVMAIFLVTAILFNPIIPVHLTREIWLIDVAAGLFFFFSIKLFKPIKGKQKVKG